MIQNRGNVKQTSGAYFLLNRGQNIHFHSRMYSVQLGAIFTKNQPLTFPLSMPTLLLKYTPRCSIHMFS